MKDVGQMLNEIEEIEEQELKNFGQPQYNEKGLEEKKAKLHASIHRVARYYVSVGVREGWQTKCDLSLCQNSNKKIPRKRRN